jgi:hypothetical protein
VQAKQKAIVEADNAKLKEDNESYRKGSGQLRVALEKSEAQNFTKDIIIREQGEQVDLCKKDKETLNKEIEKKDKKLRRARTGTKIVAGLGLALAGAALLL